MANSLEERVKLLEETIAGQSKEITRLKDVAEIENLLGRYVWQHEVQRDPEFIDTMFAQKREDISWEVAHFGYFKGRESVKRALDSHRDMGKDPGTMFLHCLTTQVLEVAGDGKTAKGVWLSPGAETVKDPITDKLRGMWAWTKYAVDFIKEDGAWKVWHYHVYRIFMSPSDMDFTADFEKMVLDAQGDDAPKGGGPAETMHPDGPPTYDNPYNSEYHAKLVPAPPEPYGAFDPAASYGPK